MIPIKVEQAYTSTFGDTWFRYIRCKNVFGQQTDFCGIGKTKEEAERNSFLRFNKERHRLSTYRTAPF